MVIHQPPINDPEKKNEQIIAYLDGELPSSECCEVEARISADDAYRELVQDFQNSWGLLDRLPQTKVDQRFAASTVEMIAVNELSPARELNSGNSSSMPRQWSIVGFSVLAACLCGFFVTTVVAAILESTGTIRLQASDNKKLLSDLPILANLDKFQLIDDLEFLHWYDNLPPTTVDEQIESPQEDVGVLSSMNMQQRRTYVDQMQPVDKKQLATNLERFENLAADRREHLRRVYQELAMAEESDYLFDAMDRYFSWYRSLPPSQRVELRVLPAQDRRQHVVALRQAEEVSIQNKQDASAIKLWLGDVATANKDPLLRANPVLRQNVSLLTNEEDKRRELVRALLIRIENRIARDQSVNIPLTHQHLQTLKSTISPDLAAKIDEEMPAALALKSFVESLPDGVRRELPKYVYPNRTAPSKLPLRAQQSAVAGHRLYPRHPKREQLMKFYNEELRQSLTTQQQQRLDNMQPHELERALRDMRRRWNGHYGTARSRPLSDRRPPPDRLGPPSNRSNDRHDHDSPRGRRWQDAARGADGRDRPPPDRTERSPRRDSSSD